MGFAAKFDGNDFVSAAVSPDGHQFHFDQGHAVSHHAVSSDVVIVPDAHLLFSGQYSRAGLDLVLTAENQKYVVPDYFRGEKHPSLASPDGATLSPSVIDALTGHTAYAEDSSAPPAGTVIGHVLKLTGSASVIRNGVTVELGIGDAVMKGDVVQTGSDSSIGMTFMDGSAFGMTSNARMVLNDMVYDPNGSANSSLISLVQGTITFVAGQTAKNGHMKVETPVATMGIRGTAVLVEIDSNDGPTKFSVLVEPDGHTGVYDLYDKTTGALIGSVSQAGQVTFVSALGDQDALTTAPKSLTDQMNEKAIIQQVFQLYFPNYNPDANPKSNNRGDAGSSVNNLALINTGTPQSQGPDAPPNTIQVKIPHTDPVTGETTFITVTEVNTRATFFTISETENQNGAAFQSGTEVETQNGIGFNIKDHVVIVDPDIGKPPFFDVATPFVSNSAKIVGVVTSFDTGRTAQELEDLVDIDQTTGQVSFKPGAFNFLGLDANGNPETAKFTITFLSKSGPDTALQSLVFTITGLNDTPTISVAPITLHDTASWDHFSDITGSLTGSDADQTDTLTYAVRNKDGQFVTGSVAGKYGTLIVNSDGTYTYEPNDVAINALRGGDHTDTFTVEVKDNHGATQTATFTVNVDGANDRPHVKSPLSFSVHEGDAPVTKNLLHGAFDVDYHTTLLVTALTYSIDGFAMAGTPDGLSVSGSKLTIDPSNAAFNSLAAGEKETIVVSYDVSDGHASAHQTETITIVGTNDAPTLKSVSAGTFVDTHADDSFSSLHGSLQGSDPDHGETQTLTYGVVLNDGTVSNDSVVGKYGTLIVSSNGTYTYVPNDNAINALHSGQHDTDTFTIETTDAHDASTTATFTVAVDGANDDPVLNTTHVSMDQGFSHFGFTHTFTFQDLVASDADHSSGSSYALTLTADDGTLSMSDHHNGHNSDGLSVSGEGTHTLTLTGTLSEINNALDGSSDGFTYSTSSFETGVDKVQATLTDGHGGSEMVNFIFRQDVFALGSATMTGTNENDVFFSSSGNDKMISQGGHDQFVFSNNIGHDTIEGFNASNDTIEINGHVQTLSDLMAHASISRADTVITPFAHDPFDTILLKGFHFPQGTGPGIS
jgi:VCBS repeat-containing protein